MNVLPLRGFAEVNMMTLDLFSLSSMNSMLVRNTRNASLMTLRLLALTTTARLSFCCLRWNIPFFFLEARGISPMKGIVRFSKSLRPRTNVFMFPFTNMITRGIKNPKANATNKMFLDMGAVGNILPLGIVIIRVL